MLQITFDFYTRLSHVQSTIVYASVAAPNHMKACHYKPEPLIVEKGA